MFLGRSSRVGVAGQGQGGAIDAAADRNAGGCGQGGAKTGETAAKPGAAQIGAVPVGQHPSSKAAIGKNVQADRHVGL